MMSKFSPVTKIVIEGFEVKLGEGVECVRTSGDAYEVIYHPRKFDTIEEVIASGALVETTEEDEDE